MRVTSIINAIPTKIYDGKLCNKNETAFNR